jgi:hypothetical protein
MINVFERARRYLAKCPPAISGQGGHDQTFHTACMLTNGFALAEADALQLLHEWNAGCQPPWAEHELLHKVRSAMGARHAKPRGHLIGDGGGQMADGGKNPDCQQGRSSASPGSTLGRGGQGAICPTKAEFKPGTLRRIADKVRDIDDIFRFVSERSPVRVETQDSASWLRRLYRRGSGERVVLFTKYKSQGQLVWEADRSDVIQQRHLPAGKDGVWLLAQPVTGGYLPNPRLGGKMSRRSEEVVTAWRYAVLESDSADPEDWLRCLVQVPLRIVSICESGGRSIHALVRVDAESKVDWDAKLAAIKPVLIILGADRGALSAVRLTRLPQAMRGGRRQRLLYLNPEANGTAIMNQPTQQALYGRGWENQGKEANA